MLIAILSTTICFISTSSFSAIHGDTVWEIRTTGASTGAGGFNASNAVPGTDRSQQDAAQDSGTDLVSADGDASPCVITSATHNFVDDDRGNFINITETGDGFTLGFYEIVSCAANAATLDRACGTDGAKTGGDWYLGGANDHPQNIAASLVSGNKIYVKNGTYVKQGSNAYVLDLAVSIETDWVGYNASRTTIPADADRPIFDGDSDDNATNDTASVLYFSNNHARPSFTNFIFKRASADGVDVNGNKYVDLYLINTRVTGCTSDGIRIGTYFELWLYGCEVDNNGGRGINGSASGAMVIHASYIHDNSDNGLFNYQGSVKSFFSVYDTNAGHGLWQQDTDASFFNGNVFYNNGGMGLYSRGAETCFNNVSKDNSQYGFGFHADTTLRFFDYNIYHNNTGGTIENASAGDNDSTSDPSFTGAATGDFTYSSSASPAIGTAFTQTISGITGDYKWNIGLDQDANAAAGGGGGSAGHVIVF